MCQSFTNFLRVWILRFLQWLGVLSEGRAVRLLLDAGYLVCEECDDFFLDDSGTYPLCQKCWTRLAPTLFLDHDDDLPGYPDEGWR